MNRRTSIRCRALTLVELLVAISIVSILMALTTMSVQVAREAARRAACQSNLRQLGLSVTAYHDVNKKLPVSESPFLEGPQPSSSRDGHGWILTTLPYLEQGNLHRKFEPYLQGNFLSGSGLKHPDLLDSMATRLEILSCPSDGSPSHSTNQWQWEGISVALTSYKGVIGDTQLGGLLSIHSGRMPDCLTLGNCTGIFFRLTYQMPVRLAHVRDGTSNTFAIGEDVVERNCHSTAFYANGDFASTHAPLNFFLPPERCRDWWDVMSFRSNHPGGANFCMVDGHVRFVSESIDLGMYQALSTKAKGESVSVE